MNFAWNARLPRSIQESFTCRKSTTWDRRLYFPSEGRRAEDFFALKNPTVSAGFEPANLGTKGQHATSRPPKPLKVTLEKLWMTAHCLSRYLLIAGGKTLIKISVSNTVSDKCFNWRPLVHTQWFNIHLDQHLCLENLKTEKLFILCRHRFTNLISCQIGAFGYLNLGVSYTIETRGPSEMKIKDFSLFHRAFWFIKFYSHQLMHFLIQPCISLLSYIKIT